MSDIVERLRDPLIVGTAGPLKREAADEIERKDAEIEQLRGIVKEYGDDPDYARSRFKQIDLLKSQQAHDKLKIDGLQKDRERLRQRVQELEEAWDTALATFPDLATRIYLTSEASDG